MKLPKELQKKANEIKVKVGDTIKAMGVTCTIKEIYYSDVYVECGNAMFKECKDENEYYIFYDVEFRDTNNVYRHWKSSFDGGTIISHT